MSFKSGYGLGGYLREFLPPKEKTPLRMIGYAVKVPIRLVGGVLAVIVWPLVIISDMLSVASDSMTVESRHCCDIYHGGSANCPTCGPRDELDIGHPHFHESLYAIDANE